MAKFVVQDVVFTFNGVDYSDHLKSGVMTLTVETPDATTMGVWWREKLPGLKDSMLTIEALSDDAAGELTSDLWPLFAANPQVAKTATLRHSSGAISATNPEYQVEAFIQSFPLITGSVGDVGTLSIVFAPTGEVTRDITP